ncbi:MAG: glycosyltransferase [Deltaproteobacteria bacterium]|nr:glycosyltransferase [Deltaproteobacteria bacterium]
MPGRSGSVDKIADRLEIIVVNGGSEQNEEAIVKEFQKKYSNIKYIKNR